MPRHRLLSIALMGAVTLTLAGMGMNDAGLAHDPDPGQLVSGMPTAVPTDRPGDDGTTEWPNVIVILADDLDKTLMPYLPNIRHLIRDEGAELTNFYVEQSTCCTSRATLLTGRYAHNHRVIGNAWPQGGFDRWRDTGEATALPVWLQDAGYRTAMMGKYFNEYPYRESLHADGAEKARLRTYVAPGWDDWTPAVRGNAYAQTHYRLNRNGSVDEDFQAAYLDRVLGEHALSLVEGADGFDFAAGGQFLYYASYSPHAPYAYAKEFAGTFSRVHYPRTPDFNERDVSDKFGMTRTRRPLTHRDIRTIDTAFRNRIRSVQTLDRNVGALVNALAVNGALDNTYLVFTSDNGYIMGGHRREIGKYNHFQQTINVPFYVRGPGIAPGTRIDDLAGNVDIAPTIADMAGAEPAAEPDGVSLLPRLTGGPPLARRFILLGRDLAPTNKTAASPLEEMPEQFVPDAASSRKNDFAGVMTGRFKLVRYTYLHHEELYDLDRDPYELRNLLAHGKDSFNAMSPTGKSIVRNLRAALTRLSKCDGASCRF